MSKEINRRKFLTLAGITAAAAVVTACTPQQKKELAGGYHIGQEANNQGNIAQQEPPPVVPVSTDVPPEVHTAVPDKSTAQPTVNKKVSRRETAQAQTATAKEVDKRMAVVADNADKPNSTQESINPTGICVCAGVTVPSLVVLGLWAYSTKEVEPLVAQKKEQGRGYYPNVDPNAEYNPVPTRQDILEEWRFLQQGISSNFPGPIACFNSKNSPVRDPDGQIIGFCPPKDVKGWEEQARIGNIYRIISPNAQRLDDNAWGPYRGEGSGHIFPPGALQHATRIDNWPPPDHAIRGQHGKVEGHVSNEEYNRMCEERAAKEAKEEEERMGDPFEAKATKDYMNDLDRAFKAANDNRQERNNNVIDGEWH